MQILNLKAKTFQIHLLSTKLQHVEIRFELIYYEELELIIKT